MKKAILALFLSCSIAFAEEGAQKAEEAFQPALEYTKIEDRCSLKILSPQLKERRVAKLELKNGLKIFLVSDPKANASSAAITVASGSWRDPKKYPGMAHFVEHMLFKGTEKYPEEEGFIKFIWGNSGNFNAGTYPQQTVYAFSINNEKFQEALDRFSYFFICPLFSPSCVSRELFAVDQEHAKNLENDDYRLYQVSKEICNPLHPHSKFSTGNSETLSKIPLAALKRWYGNHYSANQMCLTVYSDLPLEKLTALVAEKFKAVPNRNLPKKEITVRLSSELQKGRMVYIKPIKNCQKLYLEWELPQELALDTTKSVEMVKNALSCGQKNCLKEELKGQRLIEDLNVYAEKIYPYSAQIAIEIKLTNQGLQNYNSVIKSCFEAISNFQKKGIPQCLFEEKMAIARMSYAYQGEENPFSFAMQNGASILEEELSTYPQKQYLGDKFDSVKINAVLAHLTAENCHFYLMADPKKVNVEMDRKEKWMGVEYAIKELDLSLFANLKAENDFANIKPNPYVPTKLALCPRDGQSSLEAPQKIVESEKGTCFFAQDDKFQIPQSAYFINIKTPALDGSPKAQCLGDLYLSLLAQRLDPIASIASEAGLKLVIESDLYSIKLTLWGFDEKASLLLKEIMGELKKPFSKELFSLYLTSLKKEYKNSLKNLPVRQAQERVASILYRLPSPQEKYRCLKYVAYEEFLCFQQKLFEKASLEAFFDGNLEKSSALESWQDALNSLECQAASKEGLKKQLYLLPEAQGPFLFTENTKAKGSGLILLLDQGPFSHEARAAQCVLSQALSEAFFTALRSKQKTAYFALSQDREEEKHLFQYFMVQSATHSTEDLLSRFEIFIEDFAISLEKEIPIERFEEIKKGLYATLTKPPQNLLEISLKQNLLAFGYDGDFKWTEKRAQAVKELKYEDFLSSSKSFLSRKNKKRLAVAIKGPLPEESAFSYERFIPERAR